MKDQLEQTRHDSTENCTTAHKGIHFLFHYVHLKTIYTGSFLGDTYVPTHIVFFYPVNFAKENKFVTNRLFLSNSMGFL